MLRIVIADLIRNPEEFGAAMLRIVIADLIRNPEEFGAAMR